MGRLRGAGSTRPTFYSAVGRWRLHAEKDKLEACQPRVLTMNHDNEINQTIVIRRSASDLYAFWRDLGNLQEIMPDGVSVRAVTPTVSHWTVRVPGGHVVEWDAEITDDKPGRLIAWRSRPPAEVENTGSVRFEPESGEPGSTRVSFALNYRLPGGVFGRVLGEATRGRTSREVIAGMERAKQRLESERNNANEAS